MMGFRGDRLKTLRETMGLSQTEMGKKADIHYTTISSYEIGRADPSAAVLERLAKLFGVSADFLLGLTDDPRPAKATGGGNDDELWHELLELLSDARQTNNVDIIRALRNLLQTQNKRINNVKKDYY